MRLKLLLIVFIIFSAFFVNLVLAQWPTGEVGWFSKSSIAFFLGIPEEWIEWPNVFWLLILPYFATLAIIFGIFEEIRLFRHAQHKTWVYFIIAMGWAMFLIPTGFLGTIANWAYTIGAIWSVLIFVAVAFLGVLWFGIRGFKLYRPWGIEHQVLKAKKDALDEIKTQIAGLNAQIAAETSKVPPQVPDWDKIEKANLRIDELEDRRRKIMKRI